jgi:hypothetical protein
VPIISAKYCGNLIPAMKPTLNEIPPPADRLLGFRAVNALVGSACKTSHTARNLARRGLIRAVQLNDRCVRFSERSVLDFIQKGERTK